MKAYRFLPWVAALTGGMVAGCSPSSDTSTAAGTNSAARYETARQETREAVQANKDYAYAKRAEYEEKMRAEMSNLRRDMDDLSAKIEKSSGNAKAEAEVKMQAMREKAKGLDDQLAKVKDSTEGTWEDVKSGFNKGYDELKESVKQGRQWLSEKIAP